MYASASNYTRLLSVFTLVAVVLTASVPFYCSTGWCCSKHQAEEQQASVPSCCADKQDVAIEQSKTDDCCGGPSHSQPPKSSCEGGCATGCCKIAATPFVLESSMAISVLHPLTVLAPGNGVDTGIELCDHIPQPPRVLTA